MLSREPEVHPLSDVQSKLIGYGSTIWQFCVILPGAQIGRDVNICAHCFVENDVVIGNRVTIKSGVYLWDGLRVEDDVFIGPNATFTNDKFPRSKQYPSKFVTTYIREGASIGAGAIILPGIEIGKGAMIGAGSLVTRSIPEYAIAIGSPARVVAYVEKPKE
jgi:acetyltransferase-like isoleucine patch superfamily enzyme